MGIKTTYPTSDAILDITPKKTSIGVTIPRGVDKMARRIKAERYPLPSANPTPNMVTRTTPNGAKEVKLLTALVSI